MCSRMVQPGFVILLQLAIFCFAVGQTPDGFGVVKERGVTFAVTPEATGSLELKQLAENSDRELAKNCNQCTKKDSK